MASPFNVFRKYQKTLLVAAGVILMFVFVIGDSLVPMLNRSAAPQGAAAPNAVAVEWNGGRLTNQELDHAKMRRAIVNSFIQSVFYAGVEASQLAGIEPRPLKVEPIVGPGTPEQGLERDIVRLKIFAAAAREAGMSVSNETIATYLDELGRGFVSRDDMRKMMSHMEGVTPDLMFDAIREEMLARNYLASYQYALETVTPEERFRDWQSVNDRVVVEAAAIPVESFVVDVPDPTSDELLAFYEKYKQREPQPDLIGTMELPSAHPGFRVPRKYNLKYVVANYDKYLEKVENEVSEEEIAKFYEEKKDPLFIKADTRLFDDLMGPAGPHAPTSPAAPPTDAEPAPGEATESESTPVETPASTSAEAPAAGDAEQPKGDGETTGTDGGTKEASEESDAQPATGDDSAESAGEPSDAPPATESEPTAGEPAEEAPPTEEAPSTEEAPPAEAVPPTAASSSRERPSSRGVFQLAAFLQEGEAPAEPQPESPPTPEAGAAEPTEPAPASEPSADTEPTSDGESSTDGQPAPEATPAEDATPAEGAATPAPAEAAPAAESPSSESAKPADTATKPVEYQPLDEVRDQIRREIASQKTSEQLVALMDEIKTALGKEFNEYFGAVLNAEAKGKERPAPPAALADLQAIAAKHGLEAGETGLESILELRSSPVGESAEVDSDQSLLRALVTGELEMYQPVLTRDLFANRYVVMKTEDIPGKIPTLDEIRGEVVRAWKLSKAAELAKKDAEAKAKLAQDKGGTLSEFFADDAKIAVVKTDPFSWYTGGAISRISGQQEPFRLSEPEGVVAAGPEFMQAVFDLADGQVGAALNNDHTIAYVVRVADRQSTPEELHQAYLAEANVWDGLNIMTRSHAQNSTLALLSGMLSEAQVDWKRTPDQVHTSADEEQPAPDDEAPESDTTAAAGK